MARWRPRRRSPGPGVPHACGDGPGVAAGHPGLRVSSPRLWGWPADRRTHERARREFPTPVGMARPCSTPRRSNPRVPHACGDGPGGHLLRGQFTASSPRLWGWPGGAAVLTVFPLEFPTPVGMARTAGTCASGRRRVPHACGDGPMNREEIFSVIGSSTRLWGWPGEYWSARELMTEFPTPVGMARGMSKEYCHGERVPHACGDGPGHAAERHECARSSPRLWGWPVRSSLVASANSEFPTPVGMAR